MPMPQPAPASPEPTHAPRPAPREDMPLLPGPPRTPDQLAHHLVIISAAAAFLLGPGVSVNAATPLPAPPPPAHPAPPRPGRPGVWSRLVKLVRAAGHTQHPRRARPAPHPARQPGHAARHAMKLKVTVEGKTYEVEVEAVDQAQLGSAALRVEGSPLGPPAPRPDGHSQRPAGPVPNSSPSPTPAPPPTPKAFPSASPASPPHAATPPSPAPLPPHQPPGPWPDRAPWHGLSVGASPGECVAPMPGVIASVLVKPGDLVRANDPLIQLEASHILSPQEKPLVGTVRAVEAGAVAEVLVNRGDSVSFGQPLVRMSSPTPDLPAPPDKTPGPDSPAR